MIEPFLRIPDLTGAEPLVRARTLMMLRWLAVAGQLAAVLYARAVLELDFALEACLMLIGLSATVNLASWIVFPPTKRLSEPEALAFFAFDVIQLTTLLAITGGLNNPFALLILAPVAISATMLPARSAMVVAALGLAAITLIAFVHLPLLRPDGRALELPELFIEGFWAALAIGIVFVSAYAQRVAAEIRSMHEAVLAAQMALDREQKLTDLAGVVAAMAHELGTPLATVKLVSSELIEELEARPELADLAEDARLIRAQADRCRDILRSMGRAGKDDMLMRTVPLTELVRLAAEPHMDRGKEIEIRGHALEGASAEPPAVPRDAGIIHGLRNLVQNAVDFARSRVRIDITWTPRQIRVRVADDGPGYPPDLIGRLGDPFLRAHGAPRRDPERPAYEGMGLGVFIAKTLLERSGGRVTFANAGSTGEEGTADGLGGAVVEVTWRRAELEVGRERARGPLGENAPNRP